MNFFKTRQKTNELSLEEELEIYNNRLETSQYLDDKLDALRCIEEVSRKNIFLVGVSSLDVVAKSLRNMDDVTIHKNILCDTFQSENGKEFVDIFLKDESNVQIILEFICNEKCLDEMDEILLILLKNDSMKVSNLLSSMPSFPSAITSLISHSKFKAFPFLLESNGHFKKSCVFEGILEGLFNAMEIVEGKNLKEPLGIITLLLKDSTQNQNYFFELKWRRILMKCMEVEPDGVFLLFNTLLDPKNNQFGRFQESLMDDKIIELAIRNDKFDFLYSMILNNPRNSKYLIENTVDSNIVVNKYFTTQNVQLGNALILFISEVLKYKNISIPKLDESSRRYFHFLSTVFFVLKDIECESKVRNTVDFLFKSLLTEEFLSGCIFLMTMLKDMSDVESCGYFLFLILISDFIMIEDSLLLILIEFIGDENRSNIERGLCCLLLTSYFYKNEIFKMNDSFVFDYLKKLRVELSVVDLEKEVYFIDEICEYLMQKIDDYARCIKKIDINENRRAYEECELEIKKEKEEPKDAQMSCSSPGPVISGAMRERNRFSTFLSNITSRLHGKEKDSPNVFDL
jgi:hypothetical protein